ncbi:MAG: cobaltochelatase subunit CobN [Methanosarcinales archaeon]|nr:cobaltochelatase subunit CobN [Methanosarcinales archaeon]
MTAADSGDTVYEVAAKADSSGDGTYKFENVQNGYYTVIAKTAMGATPYIGIASLYVENENIADVNVYAATTKDKAADSPEMKILEIYTQISGKTPTASETGYTITGTAHRGTTARTGIELFLIKNPIITTANITEDDEEFTITVSSYGIETLKIGYTDKSGIQTEDKNPEKSGDEYIFTVSKEKLASGINPIIITASAGLKEVSDTISLVLVGTEYEVAAKTKSNDEKIGSSNFKFENVPEGKYVIMAVYFMGSGKTEYAAAAEVEVTGNTVTDDIYVVKCDSTGDIISGVFQIHQKLLSKTPTSGGTFTIEGAVRSASSNRPNLDLILVKAPVIAGISREEIDGDTYRLNVAAVGAESVTIEYADSKGTVRQIENNTPKTAQDTDAGKIFSFVIDKNALSEGYTDVSVIVYAGEAGYMEKTTLTKADPELMGVSRKVVLISGYETHNKIISNLSDAYAANGSNIELLSLETKTLVSRDKEEIRSIVRDADVISIHMVSTTPTWNYIKDILTEECKDGKVVLLDDNATRAATSYGGYTVPPVPGISDTDGNLTKYKAKVANYWSNTPYEHKNLEYMINMILVDFYGRYDLDKPENAVELPIKAIYHPHLENGFETEYDDFIEWYANNEQIWDGEEAPYRYDPKNPTVGIPFYKSYYPDKMEPTAKMIEELEKKGINVIATYCEAPAYFDTEDEGGKYFIAGEIDAVLNYRYIGEQRFHQTELDIPIFNILIMDTAEDWEKASNPFGNSSMKLVNQELIGAIDPIAVVSTEEYDGIVMTKPMNDQIDWLVGRVVGQLNLQIKDEADKNIAVVYYNHGGGKGNIGASYLDVPASTVTLLEAMKSGDYNVDTSLIPNAEEMADAMTTQGINVGGWAPGELKKLVGDVDISDEKEIYDTGKAILISAGLYEKWFREIYFGAWFEESLKTLTDEEKEEKIAEQTELYESKKAAVSDMWGKAPGSIMTYQEKYIIIPYIDVSGDDGDGRVILTPQPSRGHAESIETLYHDTNMPPTHQYIAFYLWLQNGGETGIVKEQDGGFEAYPAEDEAAGFGADAVIHLGRHGTQEWLPGKETALSRYDWPAVMTGYTPVIYPYIVDGVGEGMVAKRRGNAVLVDHMTPAIVYAGLYGDYATLGSSVQSYQTVENEAVKAAHAETIITNILSTGLDSKLKVTEDELLKMEEAEFDEMVHELEEILEDMKTSYMPYGLHVLGQSLKGAPLTEMVFSMLGVEYIQDVTAVKGAASDDAYTILKLVLEDGRSAESAADEVFESKQIKPTDKQKADIVSRLIVGKGYASDLTASAGEMDSILKALSGGYIKPKAGGDPVSRPQVLPTGGNFYTVDQRRIPTQEAWEVGTGLTDRLLAEYYEEHGKFPNSVGFVLWAGETTRTEGILEAQIMYLTGIKPTWASGGNVNAADFEVISANDLTVRLNSGQTITRPRIDVVVEISGVYRDTFPEKVLMLDRAIRLAYEQTDGINNIRTGTNKIMDSGYSKDEALSRIFGPASDSYGAGLDNLVSSTDSWENNDQLAEHFISRMGYVYNSLGGWGTTNDKDLYKSQLANIDATVHSRSSALYSAADNDDFYQYLSGLNLAVSRSREDGGFPDSYVMNLQKSGDPHVDTLSGYIENEMYARYLNQKWVDGMKEHGYAGAREIAKTFENIWGYQALQPDLISADMVSQMYEFLMTGENGEWLKSDPQLAYDVQSITATFIQSVMKKENQDLSAAEKKLLEQFTKDYVESVNQNSVACCHHSCGNPTFNSFVAGQMSVLGIAPEEQEKFLDAMEEATGIRPEITRPVIPKDVFSGSTTGQGSAQIIEAAQVNETEPSGGYGTDTTQAPGEASGYQMTPSIIDNSISSIKDFLNNPTFSASSMTAIALIILIVGAVFYGFRRKN